MNQQKSNYQWISNLRVLATISVVFLHVSSALTVNFDSINISNWWLGNVFGSCVRFCVPIFVMLTGALLLPQNISIDIFFKKRLKRVILPFLFWSVIYVIAYSLIEYSQGENITFIYFLHALVDGLINGSAFHLWYIYMLIGLYLVIPVLSRWIRNSTEKEILYFLIIWFLVAMVIGKFESLKNITPIYYSGYIGYLILGYYLSIKSFETKNNIKSIAIFLFLLGVTITIVGTYLISERMGVLSHAFYDYLTPNVLIASIGIFLLFRFYIKVTNQFLLKIIFFIDKYSYGIYLIHILVLSSLSLLGISATFIHPALAIPLRTLLCLGISFSLVYIINKLPLGKYISG